METGNDLITFGDFKFDPSTNEVFKGSEVVRLPQPEIQLLRHLLRNYGRFVGTQELFEAVWNRPFFHPESARSIHYSIASIHQAVGTGLIGFAPGEGYILSVPVVMGTAIASLGDVKSYKLRLFFSYSHKDARLRDKLESHLSVLKRQGEIEGWHDGKISAGKALDPEIATHLEQADLILLLVTAEFIGSDYCWSKEMTRALERHEKGEARVIPVILRPCDWHAAPFGKLKALPTDGKPVASKLWPGTDAAFHDVAQGVRRAIEELRAAR